uniref:ATP synthase complex subunit 8 n=1 Tax=Lissodema cursor TaxID=1586495 RepID=A0A343C352_9CUCU|nr:ATP synthase F0 subunit 8 [Lissodema cursor]
MPQMAPLNWLTLMLFFIMNFMMFNIMNYYLFFYHPKLISSKNKKLFLNWKW